MKINLNQLGLATIKDECHLIHIIGIQENIITVRPYNSTTGRWLKNRDIEKNDIKHVFYRVGGKPQTLTALTEARRIAA